MNHTSRNGQLSLFLAALLACLLLCASALADGLPPLRWAGTMYEGNYWKEHGIRTAAPDYHWVSGAELLQKDNAPDLYSDCTDVVDFERMKAANVLADLSGSAEIRQFVERTRPEIQSLVTGEDNHILALPLRASTNPVYWRQEAFDAAGLSQPPQSYTELLDFAEAWAERVQKNPDTEVCFTGTMYFGKNARYNYTLWLLDFLLDAWEMQAYEAGVPVTFDTPEFIALLDRTKAVGKLLHEAEPSDAKRRDMLPLFWNQHGSSGPDGWFNGGREEGLSHTVPFRITAEQPALMRASADLWMVRADSPYAEACIRFFEEAVCPQIGGVYTVELFREGVEPGDYHGEPITEGWLKERGEYAGKICFAPKRAKDLYENSMMQFVQGKLSSAGYAARISKRKNDPNE